MANALYTLTLQNVVNLASTHVDLLPLAGVGGYSNEPALSLCNDALSDILAANFDWRFNRVEMPLLVTQLNKQDYIFAGACAFTLGNGSQGGVGIGLSATPAITVSAGVVTVTTLEAHRFNVGDVVYMNGVTMTTGTTSKYNSTFTDNGSSTAWSGGFTVATVPSTTTFTFTALSGQNNSDAGGAPGISDFGWLCAATCVEMNNTASPQNRRQLYAVRELPLWSRVANPEKVAVMFDNGDGTIKIRFYWVPGSTAWGAQLVYQGKPPLKTALTDTWAPVPDHYAYVLRQAFLFRCYRYLNSPRSEAEFAKLQTEISKALNAADREDSQVYVVPEENLMDSSWSWIGW